MKKLLILAAVIVAGIAANAASFKWSASGIKDFAGTSDYNGTATLYAYLASADASTAVAVNTATMTAGAISAADTVFSDTDNFVGNSTYTFYYTMEDAAGNVFTSGTKTTKALATATAPIAFAGTGSWAAVPEPTSGLLMLLGMAGLALKRKRA